MNIKQINAIRVSMGLEPREVSKPKKVNNNKAMRAQENRDIKSKRTGKSK